MWWLPTAPSTDSVGSIPNIDLILIWTWVVSRLEVGQFVAVLVKKGKFLFVTTVYTPYQGLYNSILHFEFITGCGVGMLQFTLE